MKPPAEDPAVRAFIRRSAPPETFTHLAAELRARFGLDLSPEAASHLWRSLRRLQPGRTSDFERDAALMAFITDRADLMTTDRLRAKVAQAFGLPRTPSRTQLHRLVMKVREQAEAALGRSDRLEWPVERLQMGLDSVTRHGR